MSTQTDFISKVVSGAQAAQQKYGILASVTIAQAILESGWGQHNISNNLFGIKANGWTSNTVTINTKEYVSGQYVTVAAAFRAYPSFAESVEDHGGFLAGNARYKNLLGCTDAETVCNLLQQDGYATEPDYASQLIGLIRQYSLTQYDKISAPTPAPASANTLHHVGENVVFSTCYRASDDGCEKAIGADKMLRNHGVITKIYSGTHNPYLLDDGLCFVNDGDIRGSYNPAPAQHVETVKSGTWYVHTGAGTAAGVIGTVKGGQAFVTAIVGADWRRISFNGRTGYLGPAAFR
jgi:hypothetical protein